MTKHAGGRPTTYDPAYCEQVIEYGAQGKSKAWIAAEIGVHRDTLSEWSRVHPEFSAAMARARDAAQKWWEDAGQNGMTTQGFSAQVWSRSMAARFPDDWRDKVALVGGDETDNPIQITDRDRAKALAALLAKAKKKG